MDLPILKYLDVLIGLALVMLLGCSVVGAVTHVINGILRLRVKDLQKGLSDTLLRLDPELPAQARDQIASLIQRHPGVARSSSILDKLGTPFLRGGTPGTSGNAPASTIQRHEFIRILLEWGAGEGPLAKQAANFTAQVRALLAKCGVANPEAALSALRTHAVAQERAFPELAEHLWHTAAAIDALPAEFVGRIHTWYDGMTTRIAERFGMHAKLIGSMVALGVALAMPFDSLDLLRRLNTDDKFRNALVEKAKAYQSEAAKLAPAVTAGANEAKIELTELRQRLDDAEKQIKDFQQTSLLPPPEPRTGEWYQTHAGGLALSWVLLALGTPFWFDALKNSLKLRSMVAQKDEKDKTDRQSPSPPVTPGGGAGTRAQADLVKEVINANPAPGDERGDFNSAVG